MTVNEIILNAEWINGGINIIIKYQDNRGVEHPLAGGVWYSDQVLYWGGYRALKMIMNFDECEAVFYIG